MQITIARMLILNPSSSRLIKRSSKGRSISRGSSTSSTTQGLLLTTYYLMKGFSRIPTLKALLRSWGLLKRSKSVKTVCKTETNRPRNLAQTGSQRAQASHTANGRNTCKTLRQGQNCSTTTSISISRMWPDHRMSHPKGNNSSTKISRSRQSSRLKSTTQDSCSRRVGQFREETQPLVRTGEGTTVTRINLRSCLLLTTEPALMSH